MSKHYSPNDQRSIVKNPNNPAYGADRANQIRQGHPTPPPPPPAPQQAPQQSQGPKK